MRAGRYDALVVGAGPAGSAAALTLARNGAKVALLERGEFPGSKNMFGGTIHAKPTEELVPAFWNEAPLERPVVTDQLWVTAQDSAMIFGFTGYRFGEAPYNKFTAFRGRFDRWFAGKAVAAGAELFTEALVTGLVREGRKVVGVVVDGLDEPFIADAVIIAEGVGAALTKAAGLTPGLLPQDVSLFVKEVLSLPRGTIEERFQLEPDTGADIGMLGYPLLGVPGKIGIWTNKDTVAITAGGRLNQIAAKRLNLLDVLARIKAHPMVNRLLQGATSEEFSAHMIPRGSLKAMPKLVGDGILITGDAAMMVSGRRGSDLAMLSGKFAAETVLYAKATDDFSAKTLKAYETRLNRSFIMNSIKESQKSTPFNRKHPGVELIYSEMMNEAAYEFFTEGLISGPSKRRRIINEIRSKQPVLKTADDIIDGLSGWKFF